MNREIEFRGYCPDLGRWIYGDLLHCGSELTEHYTKIEPRLSIAEEGIPAHEMEQFMTNTLKRNGGVGNDEK